jgi:hypothetical protein
MGDFVIVKQVVGVDVLSGHDVRQRPADSAAILDDHLMCRDVGNGDFVSRANRLEHPNVFAEDVDVVVGVQVADRNRNAVFWAEEHNIFHSAVSDRVIGGSKSTIRTKSLVANKSETISNAVVDHHGWYRVMPSLVRTAETAINRVQGRRFLQGETAGGVSQSALALDFAVSYVAVLE